MPYTITKMPDEPVVILTLKTNQVLVDLESFDGELTTILDAQPEQVYLVLDMTEMVISLDDLTVGASTVSRGSGKRLHHTNVRENLMVTRDTMMKLAVMGLRSATFGSAKVRSFETVDQALAYCREQIAAEAYALQKH